MIVMFIHCIVVVVGNMERVKGDEEKKEKRRATSPHTHAYTYTPDWTLCFAKNHQLMMVAFCRQTPHHQPNSRLPRQHRPG